MARWGIESGALSPYLPYAQPITEAAQARNFPVALAYAIAWRETVQDEGVLWPSAATVIAGDGGHGLFQLTSSYPADWQDPKANAEYAMQEFLEPAAAYWVQRESGSNLVRCIAATFNAGLGGAISGHDEGNVDKYTTNGYAQAVLGFYDAIIKTGKPV